MPITVSEVPPAAFDAVARGIVEAGANLAFTRADRPVAASRTLSLSVPHQIARLSLQNIRRGARLRDATVLNHWRYLVLEERPRIADTGRLSVIAAAIAVPVEGGYEFGSWSESNLVTGMEAAIRAVERRPPVSTGDYEPLLLLVPDVQVTALWLRNRQKPDSEDSDLILLMQNAPSEPYRQMTPREFLDQLREDAARLPPFTSTV